MRCNARASRPVSASRASLPLESQKKEGRVENHDNAQRRAVCVDRKPSLSICRFFSARKHGLVDAGVRVRQSDRTVFVALPGGVGTLDEIFEILALIQLERLGSAYRVPFLVMNYDNAYQGLLQFLESCIEYGSVREGEVGALWKVCRTNEDAVTYLRDFYESPESGDESSRIR